MKKDAKSIHACGFSIIFWKWSRDEGGPGRVFMGLLAFYQQKYLILPAARAAVLWLKSLILGPTPAYGVTKHNQSANRHRKLQTLWKGDGCFLPLISFPAMFLVLSKKTFGFLMKSANTFRVFTMYRVNYLTVQDYFHYWDWQHVSCQDRPSSHQHAHESTSFFGSIQWH